MYLFILISLFVLVVSYYFFRMAAGTMSIYRPNLVSWTFFLEFFIFSFIGANLAVIGVHNYLIDQAFPEARIKAYWTTCYVMVFTPLIMAFFQRTFLGGGIRYKVRSYFDKSLTVTSNQAVYWILLSFVAILATAYTYWVTKRMPLLDLLLGSSSGDNLSLFRQQAGRAFAGNQYIRNFLSLFLAPFVTYVAYGYARLYKRPIYWFWFLAAFGTAILSLTYDAQKSPLIYFFLSLFFARIFINKKAKRKDYLVLLLGVVGLILFTYIVFAQVTFSITTILGILSRIGMVQYAGMPLAFDVFPFQHPFLYGGGFPEWINNLIGVPHAEMSRVLMEIYNPIGVEQGTAGVINTLFIADAWANFGWLGIFFAPIWIGILIQFTHNTLVQLPKTPVYVGLMAYFMTAFRLTGGLIGFIWNPIWIFLIFIIFLGIAFGSIQRSRNKPFYPKDKLVHVSSD